jgi:hypothetical protein
MLENSDEEDGPNDLSDDYDGNTPALGAAEIFGELLNARFELANYRHSESVTFLMSSTSERKRMVVLCI